MSKRFTDTLLWEEAWFQELPAKYKLFWFFIKDRCDMSGVWPINQRNVTHFIGEKLNIEEAVERLNLDDFGEPLATGSERVVVINGCKLWLTKYIAFQCGPNFPKSNCAPHQAVLQLIEKHGLDSVERVSIPLKTREDKEVKKAKTRARKAPAQESPEAIELRDLWNKYRFEQYGLSIDDSKTATLKWISRRLKEHTPEILRRCIDWRFEQLEIEGTEGKYIGKVTNFFGDAALFENYLADDWQPPKPKRQVEEPKEVWPTIPTRKKT